jgi:hypothetical protein
MSIAIDQSRLRRIVQTLLPGTSLRRAEASAIMQIAQLCAGLEPNEDPGEHAALQAVAQSLYSLVGLKLGEVLPIPPAPDRETEAAWLRALGAELQSQGARELAYALAFLVSVADLELTTAESTGLEDLQRALDLDDRRATDLVVFLTETVAAPAA